MGLPLAMELAGLPSIPVPVSSQAGFGLPALSSMCSSLALMLWLVGLKQSTVGFSIKLLVVDFIVNFVEQCQLAGGFFVIIALPTWQPSVVGIITS